MNQITRTIQWAILALLVVEAAAQTLNFYGIDPHRLLVAPMEGRNGQ